MSDDPPARRPRPETKTPHSLQELVERLREPRGDAGAAPEASRYEVIDEVARGGMGVIFRVRDRDMRRDLAMKVMSGGEPTGSTPDATESVRASRFLDEAQITGQLEHPGIIPVHELGIDSEGRLFFTMRLVKGATLGEVFEHAAAGTEGWTQTRALGVLLRVCEAMAFAHDKQVVHRDLKPANIMVGRFGETYVMDWGLAKLVGEGSEPAEAPAGAAKVAQSLLSTTRGDDSSKSAGASSLATLEGDVMGTPAYMPPEQARGQLERVGPRSDVYAVGAMLYHLLAGHAPYQPGGDDAKTSPMETVRSVMEGPPDPLARVASGVPPELVAICELAMQREPDDRYPSMLALAEDVRAYLENRVVGAHATGALIEFKKWVERNRGMAASIAAAALIAVAGLIAISVVQSRGRAELADANIDLSRSNEDLATARDQALSNERRALDSELEARLQGYDANVHAATALLASGNAGEARTRLDACDPALRGWEWKLLWNRADSSLATLVGPRAFVLTTAFDPEGRLLASGGGMLGNVGDADYAVRVHDVESGELLQTLEGHQGNVVSVAFSPSGTELASGGADGVVLLWDVVGGELAARLDTMGGTLAYHPDGRLIAVGQNPHFGGPDGPGRVAFWDTYEDAIEFETTLPSRVQALAFSDDGRLLAAGCRDARVHVFDVEEQRELHVFDARGEHPGRRQRIWTRGVTSLDFDADRRRLLASTTDGQVRAWELSSGRLSSFLEGQQGAVLAARFHPTGPWIVSGDVRSSLRFWDAETSELIETLHGHSTPILALDISPGGELLASGGADETLRLWDAQPGAGELKFSGSGSVDTGGFVLAFDPTGEHLAWRADPSTTQVLDALTGEGLFSLPRHRNTLQLCVYLPDGSAILTADNAGRLRRWSPDGARLLASERVRPGVLRGALHPDGMRIALATGASAIQLRDARTLELIDTVEGNGSAVRHMTYTPDGTRLVCALDDARLQIHDLEGGAPVRTIDAAGMVTGVVLVPGTETVVLSTMDVWSAAVEMYDIRTGALLGVLEGHQQPAAIAISPDGSRILAGGWDNGVGLWDLERGEILSLPGHDSPVARVAFSPDGERVASVSLDGVFRVLETTSPADRATRRRAAAARRRWTQPAAELCERLFETLVLKPDVLTAIEADASLNDDLRLEALRQARLHVEDPEVLIAAATAIALEPDRSPDEYLRAVTAAERAHELWPDEGPFQHGLGGARARMGRVAAAVEAFEDALAPHQELRYLGLPEDQAFLAMTHARLDQDEAAAEALATAREMLAESSGDTAALERLVEEATARVETR